MNIRANQLETLTQTGLDNFASATAEDLKRKYPRPCRLMGDDALNRKVAASFDGAHQHRFQSVNGLKLFAELSVLFGVGFHLDPLFPWVENVLGPDAGQAAEETESPEDTAVEDEPDEEPPLTDMKEEPTPKPSQNDLLDEESDRVDRLYNASVDYYHQVTGPGLLFIQKALSGLRRGLPPTMPDGAGESFRVNAKWRLSDLYPEKVQLAGDDHMEKFLNAGMVTATTYGLSTGRDAFTCLLLMFFLGSSFDQDPQYPFVTPILSSTKSTDRAEQLHAALVDYINQLG